MNRRGFLGSVAALAVAPALKTNKVVTAEQPTVVRVSETEADYWMRRIHEAHKQQWDRRAKAFWISAGRTAVR